VGGAEFVSPMSSLRMEQGRHGQAEGSFGRMKEKVCINRVRTVMENLEKSWNFKMDFSRPGKVLEKT